MRVEAIEWHGGQFRAILSGTREEVTAAFELAGVPVEIVRDRTAWAVSICGNAPEHVHAPCGDDAVREVALSMGVLGTVPFHATMGGSPSFGGAGQVTVESGGEVRVVWDHEAEDSP